MNEGWDKLLVISAMFKSVWSTYSIKPDGVGQGASLAGDAERDRRQKPRQRDDRHWLGAGEVTLALTPGPATGPAS